MESNIARKLDRKGHTIEAINLYEELISQGAAEFLDYVNLICIYFNCIDHGFAKARNIPEEIVNNCSGRALELVDEAQEKFGANDELVFWKGFIPFLGWGDEIDTWDLKSDSLVPYVYIAMENPIKENIQKARQLYSELEKIEKSHRRELFMGRLEMLFDDLQLECELR